MKIGVSILMENIFDHNEHQVVVLKYTTKEIKLDVLVLKDGKAETTSGQSFEVGN